MPVFVPVEDVDIDAIKDAGGLSAGTKKTRAGMIKTLETFLKTLVNKEKDGDTEETEITVAESPSAAHATDEIGGSILDSLIKKVK